MLVAQRPVVDASPPAGLIGPHGQFDPIIDPNGLVEPQGVVDAGSDLRDRWIFDLAEAGPEIRDIGQGTSVDESSVRQCVRRTDPEVVAEHDPTFFHSSRCDLDHFHQFFEVAANAICNGHWLAPRERVDLPPVLVSVKRRQHGEDGLTVLHCIDVPRREAAAISKSINEEDDRKVWSPGPQEIAVKRVRESIIRHGVAGGAKRLSGDLATVEGRSAFGIDRVDAAKDVAIDYFEIKQSEQVSGGRPLVRRSGCRGGHDSKDNTPCANRN